jgi:hypothetical protein
MSWVCKGKAVRGYGGCLSSVNFGRGRPRPLCGYTLLRGWLPPSTPHGCLWSATALIYTGVTALEPWYTLTAVAVSRTDLVACSLTTGL